MNSGIARDQNALSALGGFTVRRATVEEFRDNRILWNNLVSSMRFASPFCRWEWIFTWWEQFGDGHELVPLFVYDGKELRGILPLFRHHDSMAGRWFKGTTLNYCGATDVYPDHLDVICAPGDAPACIAAALEFFATSLPGWGTVRLTMLAQDSELLRVLGTAVRGKLRRAVRRVSVAPYIALTGSFEAYLTKLPKKDRYKIKSPRKKLLEEGGLHYATFEPSEFEAALRTLFRLHARRAEKKRIASTFDRPAVFEFHRALLQRMNPNDVILRCLRGEAGIVAVLYGFRCGDRIFFYQLGYDPDWSWASPGVVLVSEAIREAFTMGCTEYNFLQGDEPYKRTFTRQARILFDCHIYNATFSGWLARNALQLRDQIKAAIRRDGEIPRTDSAGTP